MRRAVWLAAFALGCMTESTPQSAADCAASRVCHESGRCAFDAKGQNCVVGTDAHCAASNLCNKEGLCRKVGSSCGK